MMLWCSQMTGQSIGPVYMWCLQRLAEASLTLNLAKGEFCKATVIYMGKQICPMDAKVVIPSSHFKVGTPGHDRLLQMFL